MGVRLLEVDLLDRYQTLRTVAETAPDEVYNLAGHSFVPQSWEDPATAIRITSWPVIHLMDAVREVSPHSRLYQSSTSEIFGLASEDQVLELARQSEISIYTISLRDNAAKDDKDYSPAVYLLSALARESGGRSYFPNSLSELDSVYDRIAEELRTLYSVGYVSSNPRRDGKWRRIVVRVPGREGLQIRHKIGYYAPAS